MVLGRSLNHVSIIFESDNQCLIEVCSGNIQKDEIRSMLDDIRAMKEEFQDCCFTWTAREGNGVAHTILSLASIGALHGNWILHQPSVLHCALATERYKILGFDTPR